MNENPLVTPRSGEKYKFKPLTAFIPLMFVIAFAVLIITGVGTADDSDAATTFTDNEIAYTVTDGTNMYVSVTGQSLSASKDVTIPSTVTYETKTYTVTAISNNAFWNCTFLTSVVIPDSVTSIGNSAFQGCKSLTSATLGSGVATIGVNAFFGCSALNSIYLPSSVTSVGNDAFGVADTTNRIAALQSITVDANNNIYSSENGILFDKNKTTMVQYPAGKTASSYDVPASVKTIGIYAFYGCFNLTSITLPNGLETIGDRAFSNCIDLVSLTLPDTVVTIGTYAFASCSALSSMNIPASIESIGETAFASCNALESITVDENNKKYLSEGGVVFNKDKTALVIFPSGKVSREYDVPNTVKNIANSGFYSCIKLYSVVLPDGLESIGDYAFYGCRSLISVTLGTGTPSIVSKNYPSFTGCSLLVEICNNSELPLTKGDSGYGYIAKNAVNIYSSSSGASILKEQPLGSDSKAVYYEQDNVTTLVTVYGHGSSLALPKNLDGKSYEIHDYAFYQHTLLENVFISSGVTKIGNYAFQFCPSLAHVDVDNTTPPAIGKNIFGSTKGVKVFVPLEANATYKDTDVWKDFDIYSYITEPKAKDDLTYDRTEQTGVAAAAYDEYTLGGTFKATNVGKYTATATPNTGFLWSDDTADAKSIDWYIAKKEVTVSGITANNKEYDGKTSAVLDYSGVSITGIIGSEVVTVSAVGTFSDVYIGTGKTVSISNIVLAGADAGNYVLASTGQQTSTTAHISGTVKFQYENTAQAADTITLVDIVSVDEPKLALKENDIIAGWYNGDVLWNFADKIKVSIILTVKISEVTSGATVIQAEDKKAVDVELKSGTTSVTAILSDGTVAVRDLSSTARLMISVEKQVSEEDRFDITVKLGDAAYTDKPIVITLPYEENKGVPNVYYYPADGDKVKMSASVDKTEGLVTFTTTHNSVYGIEYTAEPEKGISTTAVIICVVLDILIALAIAVYFVKHKD